MKKIQSNATTWNSQKANAHSEKKVKQESASLGREKYALIGGVGVLIAGVIGYFALTSQPSVQKEWNKVQRSQGIPAEKATMPPFNEQHMDSQSALERAGVQIAPSAQNKLPPIPNSTPKPQDRTLGHLQQQLAQKKVERPLILIPNGEIAEEYLKKVALGKIKKEDVKYIIMTPAQLTNKSKAEYEKGSFPMVLRGDQLY